MILDAKLLCPRCGCESPWRSFKAPEEILELGRLAARFGKSWPWVEEYLHCFRSSIDKPLRPARMRILLREILEFVDKKGFVYDRQEHAVRADALFVAIRQVAMTNKTGFTNHNYLKKVAIGINQKMIERDDQEQRKKEQIAQERFQRDARGPERIKEIMGKLH